MTEQSNRLKPYEVFNGGKKILKRNKKKLKTNKSRTNKTVQKRGKVKTGRKTTKSRKHIKSLKSRKINKKIQRSKRKYIHRKRKHSQHNKHRLRGGSGAASSWAQSFNDGGTTFCPDGKIEVPYIPTSGVEKAGPIGINDVNKSLTAVAAQSNANRAYDNLAGKA